MAEESDLEKSEEPTQHRLEQAREEGLVPRSRELSTLVVTAAGLAGVWVTGQWAGERLSAVMRQGLAFNRDSAFDGSVMLARVGGLFLDAALTLLPVLALVLVAALAAPILLGGAVFAPRLMAADPSRLDPFAGLGRMFSLHGFVELLAALAKPLLIVGIALWALWRDEQRLLRLMLVPLEAGLPALAALLVDTALLILLGLALLAAIDVPFQLRQYHGRLRMSREELKQEAREQEGDPRVKARLRARQLQRARRR